MEDQGKICFIGDKRGDGDDAKLFVDLTNDKLIEEKSFSKEAPEWRIVHKGLNIEGDCKNPACKAFKKGKVIVMIKSNQFDFMFDN